MNTTRPLSGRGKEINYWFHSLPLGTVGPVANFRECHESLCWGHVGAFSAFRLEPSLQLWSDVIGQAVWLRVSPSLVRGADSSAGVCLGPAGTAGCWRVWCGARF